MENISFLNDLNVVTIEQSLINQQALAKKGGSPLRKLFLFLGIAGILFALYHYLIKPLLVKDDKESKDKIKQRFKLYEIKTVS